MFIGTFKTAYLQREIPMEIVVVPATANTPLHVGQLVTLEPADDTNPEYIYTATGADVKTVLTNATHIIAQSDMTLAGGHVPVENRDYRYSDAVAPSASPLNSGNVPAGYSKKMVALFKITDKDDIKVMEVN